MIHDLHVDTRASLRNEDRSYINLQLLNFEKDQTPNQFFRDFYFITIYIESHKMSISALTSGPKLNPNAFGTLLETYPKDKPIHMLNLLRFRPTTIYTPDTPSSASTESCTGHSAYHDRYLPAVRPILAELGAEIIFHGKAWEGLNLFEGGEEWDEVMIVRYPSLEIFKGMAEDDRYKTEAGVHRVAALGGMALVPMAAL
jgi:uncharacterized protein (DUF1330 family)